MAGFLICLSAAVFLVAEFYASDEASMRFMLMFAPWVGVVYVPALAIGMWVDEKIDSSSELSQTLPISIFSIILGKFFAGNTVLCVILLFTAPFPFTIFYLGDPDIGRVAGGYFGLALMFGLFFAIALFAVVLTRERVGGFIVGLSILFLVMLLGWDVFANLLRGVIEPQVIAFISLYSPRTWILRMGDGLIEFAGIIYFTGATGLALVLTTVIAKKNNISCSLTNGFSRLGLPTAVGMMALVPYLADKPIALDLTEEQEYSLHKATQNILRNLPNKISATLYWSANESSVPIAIKSHARRIRKVLSSMAQISNGKFQIFELDPLPDSNDELQALSAGVRRVPMTSGDHFYLGLTLSSYKRKGEIAYFDLSRDRFVEYDIAQSISTFIQSNTPKLGIISPLLPSSAAINDREGLSFVNELKRAYDVAVIPYFKKEIPIGLDALLIMDASILRREMLFAIDQFVMSGGSLIIMIDPFVRFNRGSNSVNPSPSGEINDISDLLMKWGVKYNGDRVIGDRKAASPVADQNEARLYFPFWMRIRRAGLNEDHPASASLNEIFLVDPGSFEFEASNRILPLVSTSTESGFLPRKGYGDRKPRNLANALKTDGNSRKIAVAIQSPFESAFDSPVTHSLKHQKISTGSPQVFAIADVDWVFDPFSLQRVNISGRTIIRPLNDNLVFLLNLIEVAARQNTLSGVRARGKLQRPFLIVHELSKTAQNRYREEEEALLAQVTAIEVQMQAALRAAGETSTENLPPTLKAEILTFRKNLIKSRSSLRDLRRKTREDVELLGKWISSINILAGPCLVVLFWFLTRAYRHSRRFSSS